MVHTCKVGRCRDVENGKCNKGFPKDFRDETSMDGKGFPLYARPENGRTWDSHGKTYHNGHIVPYNPHLLMLLGCHVNVEFCANMHSSTKYIHKYITKGPDRATLKMSRDEIKEYIDAWYIGVPEACWRIFHYELHEQIPNIVRLPFHLPGQHLVRFNPEDALADIVEDNAENETMLTQFFKVRNEI